MVREITVKELKTLLDNKADIQLIDVREPDEYHFANLNGQLMPMGQIEDFIGEIDHEKQVIIHCRSGVRSGKIVEHLQNKHGFTNLFNLKGGILQWADEIDTSVPKY